MKKILFFFVTLLTGVCAWAQNDMLNIPLTLEAVEAGVITFENKAAGAVVYQLNSGVTQTIASNATGTITVNVGDKVVFYGDNTTYGSKQMSSRVSCTSDCYIYGNIMSLISSTDYSHSTKLSGGHNFIGLFYKNIHLKNHPNKTLELPATTLAESCYTSMFSDCTGLTKAPVLPATTLAANCYSYMFSSCTSLIEAPVLSAIALTKNCYRNMFEGCTGLTKAPVLPATMLAGGCYFGMFSGCTGIGKTPELPATTLAESCYSSMFSGCIGLKETSTLPAVALAENCYSSMFSSCTSLTEAPVLPALILTRNCYFSMFSGCTLLKSLTCLATDISAVNCTTNWLNDVAESGIFTKAPNMNNWSIGTNGIPRDWTVTDYVSMDIREVKTESKIGRNYDIGGRKVTEHMKGVTVVNGRLIIVK